MLLVLSGMNPWRSYKARARGFVSITSNLTLEHPQAIAFSLIADNSADPTPWPRAASPTKMPSINSVPGCRGRSSMDRTRPRQNPPIIPYAAQSSLKPPPMNEPLLVLKPATTSDTNQSAVARNGANRVAGISNEIEKSESLFFGFHNRKQLAFERFPEQSNGHISLPCLKAIDNRKNLFFCHKTSRTHSKTHVCTRRRFIKNYSWLGIHHLECFQLCPKLGVNQTSYRKNVGLGRNHAVVLGHPVLGKPKRETHDTFSRTPRLCRCKIQPAQGGLETFPPRKVLGSLWTALYHLSDLS